MAQGLAVRVHVPDSHVNLDTKVPCNGRDVRSAKYGKLWKTNILGRPTVMVFEEGDCRRLLKEEGNLVEVIWPDVTSELVRPAAALP
jgi:hypothetical protein